MYQVKDERYNRQIVLDELGTTGQQKLSDANVQVIGAGGLGCPALLYLAAAGIGTIGIADADVVSLSNLQRQVLYTVADVGTYKTSAAAKRLAALNPDLCIHEHLMTVDNTNALELLGDYDIIIDGTDNFQSRYLINDACALLKKPLIYAAIYHFEGQVSVFNCPDEQGHQTQYRHLFPEPPGPDEAPDCNAAGVLGVLPGIIGTMQATEAIKLIAGFGRPLTNRLLTYNLQQNEQTIIDLTSLAGFPANGPETRADFEAMDYAAFCRQKISALQYIAPAALQGLIDDETVAIIDVREAGELPIATFRHRQVPLSVLKQNPDRITAQRIVLFCKSGTRSEQAAGLLYRHFGSDKDIFILRGGLLNFSA